MITIGDAFSRQNNNFTALRLIAAISVLYFHCYPIASGKGVYDPVTSFLKTYSTLGLSGYSVGAFFVISGFLVTASFINRQDIFSFAEARILRIAPGLLVALIFCAFIIGPVFTELPISGYLGHKLSWRFVYHNVALLFGIQYQLPGVFLGNPLHGVNGSLWTLPVELIMYIWVALLGLLGTLGQRAVFNVFAVVICLIASQENAPTIISVDGSIMNPLFFLIGAFLYVNRFNIPLTFPTLLLLFFSLFVVKNTSFYEVIVAIFFSYAVIFIALDRRCLVPPMDRWGDVSYGVYIYAFPLQQAFVSVWSNISPGLLLVAALPTTLIVATLSWKFIEKPVLAFKGRMPMGRRFLDPRLIEKKINDQDC